MLFGAAWLAIAHAMLVPIVTWVVYMLAIGPAVAEAQAPAPAPEPQPGEDEVIYFEELEGDAMAEPLSPAKAARLSSVATFRGEIGALGLFDTHADGDLEDAYEARLRASFHSEYRQSERLIFVLGGRLDYFWGLPDARDQNVNDSLLDESRYELDPELMAAYVAVSDGTFIHAKVGQQVVANGRLDVLTGLDPLGVYDARAGPALTPDSMRLPQPALRVEFDSGGALVFQATLVPWFRPHRLRLSRDRYGSRMLLGDRAAEALDPNAPGADASQQTIATEANLAMQGPSPSLSTPQFHARVGFRPKRVDLGFSAATALEKQPFLYPSAELENYILDQSEVNGALVLQRSQNEQSILDVEYPRYALFGFDIGGSLGDTGFGVELAGSPERQLYTTRYDGEGLPRPNETGPVTDEHRRPQGVPVVQGGLHLDRMWNDRFVLMFELTYFRALFMPHDTQRHWAGLDPVRADLAVGMIGAQWRTSDGSWHLGLSTTGASDQSLFLQPQIEYLPVDMLILVVGGVWALAAQPRAGESQPAGGAAAITLGGLYDRSDHIYLGARLLW